MIDLYISAYQLISKNFHSYLIFNWTTGCLSEEDAKEFENFALPYTLRDSGQLHEMGADEHFSLGQFWQEKFPTIFGQKFSESLYKVTTAL